MTEHKIDPAFAEEFDSDEEDDDYIPSGEDESEEEIVGEVECEPADSDESPNKGKKRKSRNHLKSTRKKRGETQLEETEATSGEEQEAILPQDEESKKKRADSLWADFLSDVSPPNKKESTPKQVPRSEKVTKKVTVTKVFHFAGEEVKLRKEVDAKEAAKDVLEEKDQRVKPSDEKSDQSAPCMLTSANGGQSRRSGLSNVLGKITGHKNKLSTLEKSKLDWDQFKTENQLSEVLEQHNRGKDGYLERQAFLERTDLRQFEQEKNLRLKSRNTKNV